MKLINDLRNDPLISHFLCHDCVENGVAIEISIDVDPNKFIIIKVDDYYNSLNIKVPPSPDCLIIQSCSGDNYVVYIVELKDIESMNSYNLGSIREKFVTCLSDFMSNRFRHYFYDEQHDFLSSMKLYFIADPRENRQMSKTRTTRLDHLLALPHCEFANKKYPLLHKTPNPVVKPC